MKEYIIIGAVGVGLVAVAAIVGLNSVNTNTTSKTAQEGAEVAGTCATSRAYIEDALQTTEADGMYYKLARKSVRMPVRTVLIRMQGKTRARDTAQNSRDFAKEKLASGVAGSEKRYYLDTIISADALLNILDCMEEKEKEKIEKAKR